MSAKIQSLRGFNDILPEQTALWRRLFEAVQQVMDAYGYREIKLPLLESTDLFRRSVGEATDIVEKEMFSFVDREKASISLRPEGTAGCVRAGIENGLLHNQQQRLWYQGPMFRHERPQAGRYRQFHQIGLEAFGMLGPDVDVEILALCARLWKRLGLNDFRLEINSLGTPETRVRFRDALVEYLSARIDRLDEDSKRRLYTNPLRVLDSKDESTREVLLHAPKLADCLDAESREHFAAVLAGLDALSIDYVINPNLVRGLDYYSRTTFEWTTDQLGAQGTVCGGGRYDGLVSLLGGGEVPAIGFAMGVERLILLMQQQAQLPDVGSPQVYFCWLGDAAFAQAAQLAEQLRDAGLRVQLNAGGGAFKAQMKRADRSGAGIALILGEQELAQGVVQVKSLRGGEPQTEVAWTELVSGLQARFAGPISA